MLQTRNLEPRWSWTRSKGHSLWAYLDEELPELHCTTCGSPVVEAFAEPAPFCRSCLEWSRQANLDDAWDDLGAVD